MGATPRCSGRDRQLTAQDSIYAMERVYELSSGPDRGTREAEAAENNGGNRIVRLMDGGRYGRVCFVNLYLREELGSGYFKRQASLWSQYTTD